MLDHLAGSMAITWVAFSILFTNQYAAVACAPRNLRGVFFVLAGLGPDLEDV